MDPAYPWSGQEGCFDAAGAACPCAGSGQDGELRPGRPWPAPRFEDAGPGLVRDALTGLVWPQRADLAPWPMTWADANAFADACNREALLGRTDWRIPLRREMLSLVCLAHARPALPPGHPFGGFFQHWYWTGTASAANPGHAWRVHLEGARMFPGPVGAEHMVWPVAGTSWLPPESEGDGLRLGRPWPRPRFRDFEGDVLDRLTGLVWRPRLLPEADAAAKGVPADGLMTWDQALDVAQRAGGAWRLPTIWELETLVDVTRASPALPAGHPFTDLNPLPGGDSGSASGPDPDPNPGLWSSTSSGYDSAWAWVLYMAKGAVGVGYKPGRTFKALLTRGQVEEAQR